jgi:acyl-homoserine lactone acylase PvdQ
MAVPAATGGVNTNDPVALYDLAMAHVRGGRFVEAHRLLSDSLALDPRNASAQQRLREVEATIQALVDRHLANGQRAFNYMRYQDAVQEWEQVLSMTVPSDPRYQQAAGASYRQIIDVADWDRSVMTNVPGESGDPAARHYADLLDEWAEGRYHPMVFSRRAVEANSRERTTLIPSAASDTAKPAAASAK